MATLTNTKIKDTYDGLLKTTNAEAIGASGVTLIEDGLGNASAISIGRANNGVTVTGALSAGAATFSSATITGDFSIADKIIHTGDTNTAIRFPAADTVTIETAGSERMRIDSSGNVGIGTQTITSYGSTYTNLDIVNTAGAYITLKGTQTPVTLDIAADGTFGFVGTKTAHPLVVRTNDVERMRIDSSGNVGIGVVPSAGGLGGYRLLEIANGGGSIYSGANQCLIGSNISWSAGTPSYKISNFSTLYNQQSGFHSFSTANSGTAGNAITFTERMRIDSSGNVGIGTSSPSEKLQVLGKGVFGSDGTGSYVIATTNNDQGNARIRMINSGAGGMTFDLVSGLNGVSNAGWSVYDVTNAATRLYIDSSGNVGIGEQNPTNKLWITETSSDLLFVAQNQRNVSGDSIAYWSMGGNTNNNTSYFLNCTTAGVGAKILLYGNGGIGNIQANDANLSDERVKKDIAPLGSYWDKIKALELVTFKYKDQSDDDDNIGLIAQQVESVAPEFICNDGFGETPEDGEPLKTIYTTDLYHAAIKVLQEAMQKIETLETEIETLKAQING